MNPYVTSLLQYIHGLEKNIKAHENFPNRIAFKIIFPAIIFSSSQIYHFMGYAKMYLKITFWDLKKAIEKLDYQFDMPEISKIQIPFKMNETQS